MLDYMEGMDGVRMGFLYFISPRNRGTAEANFPCRGGIASSGEASRGPNKAVIH